MNTNTARRTAAETYRITTDVMVAVTDAEALTTAALARYDDIASRIEIPARIRADIERDPSAALLFLLDPTHGLDRVPGVFAISTGSTTHPRAD